MAAGENWSLAEVEAVVLDYMAMLKFELTGQSYNKTEHRRELLKRLDGRTDGSVELKHQNISAVLHDLGHFWIPGYKPRSNYQRILAEAVEAWVETNPDIDRYALSAAEAPAVTPEGLDFSQIEVPTPVSRERSGGAVSEAQADYGKTARVGRKHDYLAREARNQSLGKAGEELIVQFEQFRLSRLGHDRLAGKVEHVSKTQGDGLGFDILSFEPNGREHFVEVKTTAFAKETPFFASSAEVRFANKNAAQYSIYRLFEFKKRPRFFVLAGSISENCKLDPVTYRCLLT